MIWPIFVIAMLGIFCGAWVPLLPFSVAILIGAVEGMYSMWVGGLGPGWILLELFLAVTALEAGYLIGLISREHLMGIRLDNRRVQVRAIAKTYTQTIIPAAAS